MKKGFTLIELLAVIVILAILALVVSPLVGGVIKDGKISANERSVEGIIESAGYYKVSKSVLSDTTDIYNNLTFSGKKPDSAKVFVNSNGKVAIKAIYDDYCYYKMFNEKDIHFYKLTGNNCGIPAPVVKLMFGNALSDIVIATDVNSLDNNLKYYYYYKLPTDTEYTLVSKCTTSSCTIKRDTNDIYDIKVVVTDSLGSSTEIKAKN